MGAGLIQVRFAGSSFWEDSILPSITEYIRIPNKSPAYDPQWVDHGYTQLVITGVLGPYSNAHGPNEFLRVPTGKRLTGAVTRLIAAHHGRLER